MNCRSSTGSGTTRDPKAIFQVDPVPRDPEHWAYLPAFAERRMAVGIPISMVPLAKYQQASEADPA